MLVKPYEASVHLQPLGSEAPRVVEKTRVKLLLISSDSTRQQEVGIRFCHNSKDLKKPDVHH